MLIGYGWREGEDRHVPIRKRRRFDFFACQTCPFCANGGPPCPCFALVEEHFVVLGGFFVGFSDGEGAGDFGVLRVEGWVSGVRFVE